MVPRVSPIRFYLKSLSLIMLIMMIMPWFIAYVTSTPFYCITPMTLFWLPPIGIILTVFSLALIVGITYMSAWLFHGY